MAARWGQETNGRRNIWDRIRDGPEANIVKVSTKVKDLMDTKVVTVDANATVSEALKAMIQNDVWSVILSEKGRPVGVVVEHDILQRCVGKGLDVNRVKVKEIMSSPIMQIDAEAPLEVAVRRMTEEGVGRLYVVKNGRVVARITEKDVFEGSLDLMLTVSAVAASA